MTEEPLLCFNCSARGLTSLLMMVAGANDHRSLEEEKPHYVRADGILGDLGQAAGSSQAAAYHWTS